ncbi:MAG: ATP-binding cassette domain-containing protein [Methanobacteriota archaeon]
MTTPPLLSLEGIEKSYGSVRALAGVSVAVAPGEVVVLLGPSGSGKSTLLLVADLLVPPDRGAVRWYDQPIPRSGEGEIRRKIGLVQQKPPVLRRTVLENVAYGLRLRGTPRRNAEREARESLAKVGLAELSLRDATALSGGEQQRVAIARALALRPRLLLLDECTDNLDPANAANVERLVLEEARGGAAVLLATHDLFQARRLGDRVALLWDGRVIEEGPRDAFFSAPKDPRAVRFLAGELPLP